MNKKQKKSMNRELPKPELHRAERQPQITPRTEAVATAKEMVRVVEQRYIERYKNEPELFAYSLHGLEIFLSDFVPTVRPSYHEEAMAQNEREWAESLGMTVDQDQRGNMAAILHGNPDRVLVLHHHFDIVADAAQGSPRDPNFDSIIPEFIEGKDRELRGGEVYDEELWIRAASGLTSFGADNGAGGGSIRAAVKRLKQQRDAMANPEDFPTIIVLGTVEEEKYVGGAKNIGFSKEATELLGRADYIINMDMEIDNPKPLAIEGSFGLENLAIDYHPQHEELPATMQLLQIDVVDFFGGHSGLYADKQHAGAATIKQLEDVLGKPGDRMDWRLSSITSGNADNQIGEFAHVTVAVPKEQADALAQQLTQLSDQMQEVWKDEKINISTSFVTEEADILTADDNQKVFRLLSGLADLQGTSETFTFRGNDYYSKAFNLGILRLTPDSLHLDTSTRIGEEHAFGYYPSLIYPLAKECGATVTDSDPVKIWSPDETSSLPDILRQTYRELNFPKDYPELTVDIVTAGLELGELHAHFPRSQNITLGMWIDRIHQAGERMSIPSFIENTMLLMKFTDHLIENLMERKEAEPNLGRRSLAV